MNYYDEISNGYDKLYKEEQLRKWRIILDNLEIRPEDKLLDVGCGTGFSIGLLKCNAVGVEPSQGLVDKSRFKDRITIAKAEQMPFPDEKFDIVTCVTAIHNFDDIERGLKEMNRVGKERFVFSILKNTSKFNQISGMIKRFFSIYDVIDEGKDMIFFCKKQKL